MKKAKLKSYTDISDQTLCNKDLNGRNGRHLSYILSDLAQVLPISLNCCWDVPTP